jgi:hypothetical protein
LGGVESCVRESCIISLEVHPSFLLPILERLFLSVNVEESMYNAHI